jgi:hypothetical protein
MPYLEPDNLQKYLILLNFFFVLNFLINYFMLNDSPRNLIIKSMRAKNFYEREANISEAITILNDMNKSKLSQIEEQKLVNELYNSSTNNTNVDSSFKELFSKKYIKTTYIGIFIYFVYSCGYFGLYIISTLT